MKEFILDGDVVKRLLYNKPLNDKTYRDSFSGWIVNSEQPADGIVVTNDKIVITKIKPNVWFIKSNYDDMDETNFIAKFRYMEFVLSGLNEARAENKIEAYLDHPTGDTSATYYAYGLVISPINSSGLLMTHRYPWDMNIPNGYFKNAVGYYNAWNVYGYSANERRILYNWSCYWQAFNQVAFAFYTSIQTDNDGCISFTTPIEIAFPNIAIVDPTTQEAFKLYKKNELIYERDKNIENLYKAFGLLKEDRNWPYKSQWQYQNEGEILWDYNVAFKFDRSDYNYENITLPIATDLVQAIRDEMPLKFNIKQLDKGWGYEDVRHNFWQTILDTFNNPQFYINDTTFCYKLFENAKGFPELEEGDGHTVLNLKLGSNNYYILNSCFAGCDIEEVNITCQGLVQDLGDTFKYSDVYIVNIGPGIIIRVLSGAFEGTKNLSEINGLTVGNIQNKVGNKYLSENTISLQYCFEGTSLRHLTIGGSDMIVYPFAAQVFGANAKLETIDGVAFDFRFVDPNDIYNWGVPGSYGHPIFGNSIIETINIKNLNKGNWTVPMPLDDASVIYLLNNIYDLTSNDGEHLERDDNSFNGWSHSYTNQETYKTIRFNHGHYAQIIKTNWTGRKIFKLKASIATQISLMLKDQGTIVLNQQFNIATSETIIDRSANTFDEVRIGINLQNSQDDVVLILSDPFDSAASTVTSATLTLSGVQYKADFDAAIAAAQAKGWTIVFAQ